MVIVIFFVLHWYLSLFSQTFFQHRYAAHKMFSMSKVWEKFFYLFTYVTQGSSYLSPYAYGAMHRMHHAYADTEMDPHSPTYDKNLFSMMWRTKTIYNDILKRKTILDVKFTKELPNWIRLEKLADSWLSRIAWGAFYVTFYLIFATEWWMFLLLPIHFAMGPVHGAIINWFAHKYGYKNFENTDTSRNLMPVDVFMMGEGYHNNHHKFGARPNFGVKWFELDPVYPVIWLFDKIGIIKLKL
ncbi:MAG: acyl-CoA desaturase, partial [Bacteroidia bacterium]|nr:acyl-CoA desaturase [Bacteroidia bacterium]